LIQKLTTNVSFLSEKNSLATDEALDTEEKLNTGEEGTEKSCEIETS
jgi:hypothetical protein